MTVCRGLCHEWMACQLQIQCNPLPGLNRDTEGMNGLSLCLGGFAWFCCSQTKRQLEEDADREIEELKDKYEQRLAAEREVSLD